MKNHIYKLISVLLLGSSLSVAVASAPKSVRPGRRPILRSLSVAVNNPYEHLRGSLENLYGKDGVGGTLVNKFINLANDNHPRIMGDVRSEELARLGLSARGAINPELVKTWFIFQFASIPAKERNLYFAERIEELNDSDSWVEATIVELQQIRERVEKREISWSQIERLRQLHLLPNGFEEEEEEEEEAYLTGELD